ncbi:SusD family protein [Daejeonella rubra]|uniref:SusD family protein n=2 Tax=Daejeonella rubra TaxID=990371 RepID=A0A1G9VKE2_9SPHI|nr:SusD family protein [Daejeonella rubra]
MENMKINKVKALRFFFVVLLLSTVSVSCKKDFLETFPETSLSDATAFATPDRILGQVNGLYGGLKSGQHLGGRFLIYQDIRGEDFIVNKPNGVTGLDTWRHNLNSATNEVVNLWNTAYSTINQANVFLKGIDGSGTVVTTTLADQYRSEAKFVRAFCYFNLLQLYAKPYTMGNGSNPGLPLRIQAETTSANNDLARSTVAQVYTQILKDLDEAEAGLPATYASAALNSSRAHKNTAIALKTRVYLAMGNYPKVIEESNKIISATAPFKSASGVTLQLESNIATVYGGTYIGSEAVFFLPMTDLSNPGTQNQLAHYYTAQSVGGFEEFYLNPAGIFANPVYATGSTDARKSFIIANGTKNFVSKFKKPSPYTDYVPVIRYAEVLLNAAEAHTRGGNLVRGLALLSEVRKRSDANYVFPLANVGTQPDLINTILTERRIELICEGFRSFDLLRLGATIPAKSDATNVAQAVAPTSPAYIWPISAQELANNKLMTPN